MTASFTSVHHCPVKRHIRADFASALVQIRGLARQCRNLARTFFLMQQSQLEQERGASGMRRCVTMHPIQLPFLELEGFEYESVRYTS